MYERGVLRNPDLQLKTNFKDLRYGKITPTDIDAFIDFGNKVFIFIESKFNKAEMSYGQNLALERICDTCQKGGVKTYLLIVEHNHSKGETIDYANQDLRKYRTDFKWYKPREPIKLKECIDKIRKEHSID